MLVTDTGNVLGHRIVCWESIKMEIFYHVHFTTITIRFKNKEEK